MTSFTLDSQVELAAAYRHLAARRSVFALTALYEPFGLAPLEAMSCGLPAVVTQNGGPGESMREDGQEFGVLVDPASPTDVARGLLEVITTEEAWCSYREAGMYRVISRYTWERTAEGYLAGIEAMVEQELSPPCQLSIPLYFIHPTAETDISLTDLTAFYFV